MIQLFKILNAAANKGEQLIAGFLLNTKNSAVQPLPATWVLVPAKIEKNLNNRI
ncbi:MAG: hypothetical protein WBP16_16790 [Ferruginibacter sp.]